MFERNKGVSIKSVNIFLLIQHM